MRIGTDVSLAVCKAEGYLMMDYKLRELTPKSGFNDKANVRFLASLPDYLISQMKKDGNWMVGDKVYYLDVTLNTIDIWELYQRDKESIDDFVGFTHEYPTSAQGLLSLASDVNGYRGLE